MMPRQPGERTDLAVPARARSRSPSSACSAAGAIAPPPEARRLPKPASRPPGAPGEPRSSHVVHKIGAHEGGRGGRPGGAVEEEEHVETHLSLEAAKKAAEKDLPRDGDAVGGRARRAASLRGSASAPSPTSRTSRRYVRLLALLLISTSNIVERERRVLQPRRACGRGLRGDVDRQRGGAEPGTAPRNSCARC